MFSGSKAILVAVFSIVSLLGCGPKLTPLTPPAEVESPNRAGLMDLPVLQLEEQQKKPRPEKLYTLSVRNAGIRDVLLSFSRESKENIIVDPDVRGKVTVDLTDVTLPQAMDALLMPLNLDYHMESGFIRVSRPKKITRLFHLNYIITTRTGSRGMSSNITENVGSGTSGTTGGTSGTTGGTSGGTSGTQGSTTGLSNIQGSSVSGSESQDIFQELELGLKALGLHSEGQFSGGGTGGFGGGAIGTQRTSTTQSSDRKDEEDYGVFSINRQAGIIIINSYAEILGKAAELIEAIEGTIQRQVLIQAKIVEVTLDDEFIYGIDWSLIFNLRGDIGEKRGITSRGKYPKFEQLALATDGLIDTALGSAGAFSQFTMSTGAMNLVVKALEEQGDVNIISSPQVSTLNNQTAIIRVATVETVFLGKSTTIAATATTTTEGATASTVTIGVTLDVTPQISPTGVITMNIHPAITDQIGTTTSRFGDEAPKLSVRETDTVVRVRDGETIVIGGLMSDKTKITKEKFPLLWRLPGVGRLFEAEIKQVDKTDLVIFITPTVLIGDRVEDYSIEEMGRLETARRY